MSIKHGEPFTHSLSITSQKTWVLREYFWFVMNGTFLYDIVLLPTVLLSACCMPLWASPGCFSRVRFM
jgi:hypothetical protein